MKTALLFSSRQIMLFFAALFMLSVSAFADYPPVLVIDGTAYAGELLGNTINGHFITYYAYIGVSGGTLILEGATGGPVGWGVNAGTAARTPAETGTWNGSSSVTITGHTVIVPEVLVYYPSSTAAVALQGYDGVSHLPDGCGDGEEYGGYVMAYSGLGSGYIFTSGSTSPVYRYQASPAGPLSLNTSYGWPPRNLYAYPAQIVDDAGKTLTATSYTEGFDSVGYWSNVTYEDTVSGHTGGLNIVIDAHDSGGELSGYINGVGVDIAWDASIRAFPPGSDMGGLTINPQTGPPQIEWNGNLLPFKWSDVMGSDVYGDTSGRVATIDVDGNFTITDSYTTISDTWNEGTQRFGFEDNNPQSHPDIAPVSADGLNLLGFTPTLTILKTSSASGAIYTGIGDGSYYQYPIYPYTLKKSDGTVVSQYDTGTLGLPENFVFSLYPANNSYGSGGPYYYYNYEYPSPVFYTCNGTRTIDATSLFPGPDITFPISSFECYVAPVNESYPQDVYYVYGQGGMGADGSLSFSYYGSDYQFNTFYISSDISSGTFGSASVTTNNGTFSFSNFQTLLTNGTLASDDGSTIFSLNPIYQAPPNPPEIGWNGNYYWFSYLDTNGAETYYDSSSDKITISTSGSVTVTPVGVTPITGSYNAGSYVFSFGTNASMWNIVALDGSGNPLGGLPGGITPGVVIYGNSGDENFGQAIQLADGSVINASTANSCMFWSTDYSCYAIKYIGIPDGTFFIAQGQQDYSQVYKCKYPTEGGDFEVSFHGDYTGGGYWSDTNIYPDSLYINGQYAAVDSTTLSQGGSGQSPYGGVSYHVVTTGETFSIAWTWPGGFSGGVNGTYGSFSGFTGTWDGGDVFGSLPTGLVITVDAPPTVARHGSPDVQWNGIDLAFDPVASSVSGSNPQGADVYRDKMGLGLSATVGSDGSVTLYKPDGSQYTGTYNPATYQYDISGQPAGSVLAVNSQGQVLVPTVPVGGSGGGGAGTNTGALGNFDIQGNVLSLGSWTLSSGGTMNGFSLVYTDASGGQPSLLSFMAARQSVGWIWSHADTDGGSSQVTMMQLDPTNRLILSGTANPSAPAIILDPNGKSHIEPQGDMGMGPFTVHP